MKRNSFGDIKVFVEVARRGGFRAAAAHLKQTPASVSEGIQRIEDHLGVRLFERSTRSVALTAIGQQFFERSLPAIIELENAVTFLGEQRDQISGTLKLSAPYSAGPFFLDSLISEYSKAYPDVTIEIIYDDRKIDLLTEGFDAAIRSSTLLGPSTHAVPIGPPLDMSIVGSSDYLVANGTPQVPADILNHHTICYAFGNSGQLAPWEFTGENDTYVIQPKPKLIANDMRSLLNYAVQGLGLTYVYAEVASPYVADGTLTNVLSKHLPPLPRYSINYLSKKHMTRRLRAFLDTAKSFPQNN